MQHNFSPGIRARRNSGLINNNNAAEPQAIGNAIGADASRPADSPAAAAR